MTKRTLLIDGDVVAYKFAFVNQKTTDWGDDVVTVVCHTAMGATGIDDYIDGLLDKLEAAEVVVALSDDENFRKDILPSYKANRNPAAKPVGLAAMKEHLRSQYDVFQRPRLEGDDVLGILSTSTKIIKGEKIIVSADKDFYTVPGWFYRECEGEVVKVSDEEADYYHMLQTLMGDTTDNYKGCPGVGAVGAEKILSKAEGSLWPSVLAAFDKAGLGEEEAIRQARVARILRNSDYNFKTKEPKLWCPPT